MVCCSWWRIGWYTAVYCYWYIGRLYIEYSSWNWGMFYLNTRPGRMMLKYTQPGRGSCSRIMVIPLQRKISCLWRCLNTVHGVLFLVGKDSVQCKDLSSRECCLTFTVPSEKECCTFFKQWILYTTVLFLAEQNSVHVDLFFSREKFVS